VKARKITQARTDAEFIPYVYRGTGKDAMPELRDYGRLADKRLCRKCGRQYKSRYHKTECRKENL
jgi:hypothetical protein